MRFPELGATRVKICGINTEEQAHRIADLGADAIGLNFWPKSKRYVSSESAKPWAPNLRQRVVVVGVFVNPTDEELRSVMEYGLVDMLQLHGDETPERVGEVRKLGLLVIKAIQVKDAEAMRQIGSFEADAILLDSYNPVHYGGEGKTFPWELAAMAREEFPARPLILAGGLTPDNVAAAVQGTRAHAVDVASGVEQAPGIKDLAKVEAFIRAAKSDAS